MQKFIVDLHIEYMGVVRETRHEIIAENLEEAESIGKELKKLFGAFRYIILKEEILFDSLDAERR